MISNSQLTVLLVHEYFKGVHLIVLKGLADFLAGFFVSEFPIHEAERGTERYITKRISTKILTQP